MHLFWCDGKNRMTETPTGGQIWIVLARCHKAVSALVERSIAASGVGLSDFMILEALLHKGPLTIGQIQGKVLLASGSMTAAVDRLENKGLIMRRTTKEDRRVRRLELTSTGKRMVCTSFAEHIGDLNELMSVLSDLEKRQIYGPLKKLGLAAAQAGSPSPKE